MTVRTVDAVRHPLSVSIHPGALDDLEGLRVIEARSDEEVVDLLRDGVEVLITHAWRDEFLQPSLGAGGGSRLRAVSTGRVGSPWRRADHSEGRSCLCRGDGGRAAARHDAWYRTVGARGR